MGECCEGAGRAWVGKKEREKKTHQRRRGGGHPRVRQLHLSREDDGKDDAIDSRGFTKNNAAVFIWGEEG